MTAPPVGSVGDPLCRYYTRPLVGDLVVDLLTPSRRPERILDLASGSGALSMAAAKRWGGAGLVTVDIDPDAASRGLGFERHRHVVADALHEDLPTLLRDDAFDLALCNPPYRAPRWRPGFARILAEAGLGDAVPQARASAEVLFVAQNLRLTTSGGRIGLLVPDGLVTGSRTKPFRAALLSAHRVETVVQLPSNSFVGTDARAFVVVLEKGRTAGLPVALRHLDADGRLGEPHFVTPRDGEERLDHTFHAFSGRGRGQTLANLGASVARGNADPRRVGRLGLFHTCDFPKGDARRAVSLPVDGDTVDGVVYAEPGDILVARVDRGLHRKVCGVASGHMPLSESVLRVRVLPERREAVLGALLSPEGEARIAATARGVGARMIGKGDLLRMCLPL